MIDVALRSRAVAMNSRKAVSGSVFDECFVVRGDVILTRVRGVVIGETCLDAGLREAIDVSRGRRSERDAHSARDRGSREIA